jgi:hypothetical protein
MLEEKNRDGVVVLPLPLMSERQFINRGFIKYECLTMQEWSIRKGTLRNLADKSVGK